MRKHIVAGNWKMNMDLAQTQELISSLKLQLVKETDVEILIAPPFTNLYPAFEALRETPIKIAAQNMHQSDNGAFTGEISAKMLKSVGVKTVILGHSERRAMFHESNESLSEKVNTAIANEMTSIFCFGEELEDRKSDNHFNVVKKQIQDGLCHINEKDWSSIVLAYEPVWAIGTNKIPKINELKNVIRKALKCSKPVVINVEVDPNAIYSFRKDSFKHREQQNHQN